MARRLTDLALGARAAVGCRTARWRTALTALVVALGVCVLLIAASIPHAVSAREARERAQTPLFAGQFGGTRLLAGATSFHGERILVDAVQGVAHHPLAARELPPGVARLPRPGEMVVSPAVMGLLEGPGGAELRRRLGARVVGEIGPAGLAEPGQALLYRGSTMLMSIEAPVVKRFGGTPQPGDVLPLTSLLTIVVAAALLLPVAVLVSTAARFGIEERERRLAAMRLVGADIPAIARIAAAEAMVGSLLGLLAGAVGFLLMRAPLARSGVVGSAVFTDDLRPSVALAALVAVLIASSAVVATLLSIRDVAAEPLGVTRRSTRRPRRLVWRLVVPALGFALLVPLLGSGTAFASIGHKAEAAAGVILVLLGVTSVFPWAVERLAHHAPDRPLPLLLAAGRLRQGQGTTGRVTATLGLVVAGAIALSILFSAAQAESGGKLGPVEARTPYLRLIEPTAAAGRADLAALRRTPGLGRVSGIVSPRARAFEVFGAVVLAGERPSALARLQDRVAALDAEAQVIPPAARNRETHALDRLRRALDAGALTVLAMIGAGLLIATAESLRERRPSLGVLAAVGAPRTTVAYSLLWQTAIPMLGGLVLATGLGVALGAVLCATEDLRPVFDWAGLATMIAAAIIVALLASGLALPTLARAMRARELRAE